MAAEGARADGDDFVTDCKADYALADPDDAARALVAKTREIGVVGRVHAQGLHYVSEVQARGHHLDLDFALARRAAPGLPQVEAIERAAASERHLVGRSGCGRGAAVCPDGSLTRRTSQHARDKARVRAQADLWLVIVRPQLIEQGVNLAFGRRGVEVDELGADVRVLVHDHAAKTPEGGLRYRYGRHVVPDHMDAARHEVEPGRLRRAGAAERL
jgi:hypothetical protein